jgi:aspartate ammonia-lyase
MMPVIAWNALHAQRILTNAMKALRERTVEGIEADRDRCRELLDRSTAVATALSPYIGYAATAEIAKASVASGRPIRELVLERGLMPGADLDRILSAEAMTRPGIVPLRSHRSPARSAGDEQRGKQGTRQKAQSKRQKGQSKRQKAKGNNRRGKR